MKKKVIGIVVAVIIIALVALGLLYFLTDLFKTPEQLFYKNFADSYSIFGEPNSYEEFMNTLQAPVETSGEVTAKITSDDPEMDTVSAILEKGKITYNAKSIGKEQKMQYDLTLNYNNNDIITLNMIGNKEEYGVKVADIYDKYISVENNNLKALFQKLGVEDTTDIPDRIEMLDYNTLLAIDEETINHIEKTYFNVIKENIPEEAYSVEKEVPVKIDGQAVITNSYKLTLTEEQLINVTKKFFETLKDDDVTLDLIVEKYNMIAKTNAQSTEVETVGKEDLVKGLEDVLASLNEAETTSNKAFEIVVYGLKDNKARIEIIGEADGEVIIVSGMDFVKTETEKKMNVIYSIENAAIELELVTNSNTTNVMIKVDGEGTTMELNVKEEVKANGNVVIEDFTEENSVKLNDMTSEEISTLVQTLYNNVISILPAKMQLLGVNLTA